MALGVLHALPRLVFASVLAVSAVLGAGSVRQDVAAMTAGGGSQDPGTAPWDQVPRARVAEECGLDPDLMDQADLRLANTPYTIVRRGKLCWTGGYPTGTTQTYPVHSITKTFGALLVGMVASRSSLEDTDPVSDWLRPAELGRINPDATIAHVLAMTSTKRDLRAGHKGEWSYDATGDREINVLVDVMNRAIAAEPENFPGVRDVEEFAQEELFDRLGMRDSSWSGEVIGYGMHSSVEDMSRLGLFILRKGRWSGRPLLAERFVYRMTHPAFEDTNTGYGYLTQMNAHHGATYSSGTHDGACSPYTTWPRYPHAPFHQAEDDEGGSPFAAEPHDIGLAWAAGAGGQKLSVHRGLDMVITVRDDVASVEDGDVGTFEGHKHVWNEIRPALVALDESYQGDEAAFCDAYRRSRYAPDLVSPWSTSASR